MTDMRTAVAHASSLPPLSAAPEPMIVSSVALKEASAWRARRHASPRSSARKVTKATRAPRRAAAQAASHPA